jgi:endonuclease III
VGSPKGSKLGKTLEVLAKTYGKDAARNPGDKPLDHVVHAIVAERTQQRSARAAFERLKSTFVDWNELRVAEVREITEHLGGVGEPPAVHAKAELLRRTLQALFDARDTVRIEFSREEDEGEVARALNTVPGLSPGIPAAVLARALPEPPIRLGAGMSRVGQRVGFLPRTGGDAKQAQVLASSARDNDKRVLLHYLLAEHADKVCLPKGPLCDTCPVLPLCDYGKRKGAE